MKQALTKAGGSPMGSEVYILKIYRRGPAAGESMVGTIEDIDGSSRSAFRTEEELMQWLTDRRQNTDDTGGSR